MENTKPQYYWDIEIKYELGEGIKLSVTKCEIKFIRDGWYMISEARGIPISQIDDLDINLSYAKVYTCDPDKIPTHTYELLSQLILKRQQEIQKWFNQNLELIRMRDQINFRPNTIDAQT